MTEEDYEQLKQLAPGLKGLGPIALLSPTLEGQIFPQATALSRRRWDLKDRGKQNFDIIVAANVFMYSADPELWFRNVLSSCKYLVLLDIVRRRRGPGEFGSDRDCMRYAVGDAQPRVGQFFDLARLHDRLLGYRTFFGGANPLDQSPLHFVAVIRGDRTDPLLRIDDYPTGVRPLLSDLSPLHQVIEKIEASKLSYHLGIVPALLDEEMLRFLNGLERMIPAVHGFDHGYPRYAPILTAKNDPYNERSVGTFDEFKGVSYPHIIARLREGRRILEDGLGQEVEGYIPPCNRGNRRTGRAIETAGYRYYLSEKRIPGCKLPQLGSDFYGRSADYDYDCDCNVIALHTTWEWDVARGGDATALDRLLEHLAERKTHEHERGARLGALLGS
jgi:hypothetical protein